MIREQELIQTDIDIIEGHYERTRGRPGQMELLRRCAISGRLEALDEELKQSRGY